MLKMICGLFQMYAKIGLKSVGRLFEFYTFYREKLHILLCMDIHPTNMLRKFEQNFAENQTKQTNPGLL